MAYLGPLIDGGFTEARPQPNSKSVITGVASADVAEIPLAMSLLVAALLACGVHLNAPRRPLPFAPL
jgi:hypothetical protein